MLLAMGGVVVGAGCVPNLWITQKIILGYFFIFFKKYSKTLKKGLDSGKQASYNMLYTLKSKKCG